MFLGLILIFAEKDIPEFGKQSVVHENINKTYIEESYKKTHTKNTNPPQQPVSVYGRGWWPYPAPTRWLLRTRTSDRSIR